MKTHYLISSKWTHPKDAWITLWRHDSKGYCWFKEWAGLYELNDALQYQDKQDIFIIDKEAVESCWIEIEYEGVKRMVLPNTPEVRKIIGVPMSAFHASKRTAFIPKKQKHETI